MKKEYESVEDFKVDLNKEYSFKDICILNSWLSDKEFVGQMVCCKFHHEKTPSMQIGDHFYRCYGCGKKGDIFNFAQNINNYSFIEALNDIATSVGSTIKYKKGYNADEISRKKKYLSQQWEQYKKNYLTECRTNKRMVEEGNRYFPFDVGYDKEENRVVLAYMKNGEPLGFTMRRLGEEGPKWKHSIAEFTLTHLVSQIFNIDSIKNYDSVYIAEGPGDVAAMTRAGFENSVCCCGTSNISEKVLDRITSEGITSLNLIPDGDEPGQEAKIKWIKEIIKYDYYLAMNSFVLNIPEGSDPGASDVETLKKCDEEKEKCIDYFLSHISDTEIIGILRDKNFKGNPIIRKIVEKFAESNDLSFNEAASVLKHKLRNHNINEAEKQEDEYVCRLKSTAGIGDYGLKYEKLADLTPERALKILKLKYKYKETV